MFDVSKRDILISNFVKTAIEGDKEEKEIPIPSVATKELLRVIEYVKHHKGVHTDKVPKPLPSKLMQENCKDKWDGEFIDKYVQMGYVCSDGFPLLRAANYMDIPGLYNLCTSAIANFGRGETPVGLRKLLMDDKKMGDVRKEALNKTSGNGTDEKKSTAVEQLSLSLTMKGEEDDDDDDDKKQIGKKRKHGGKDEKDETDSKTSKGKKKERSKTKSASKSKSKDKPKGKAKRSMDEDED